MRCWTPARSTCSSQRGCRDPAPAPEDGRLAACRGANAAAQRQPALHRPPQHTRCRLAPGGANGDCSRFAADRRAEVRHRVGCRPVPPFPRWSGRKPLRCYGSSSIATGRGRTVSFSHRLLSRRWLRWSAGAAPGSASRSWRSGTTRSAGTFGSSARSTMVAAGVRPLQRRLHHAPRWHARVARDDAPPTELVRHNDRRG